MASILKVNTIQDATNSNTALSIDSSGRVSLPNRIAGAFRHSVSQTISNTSSTVVQLNTTMFNDGLTLDTSNYKVTVPVDGIYIVLGSIGYNGGAEQPHCGIYLNDGNTDESKGTPDAWVQLGDYANSSAQVIVQNHKLLSLTANDYLQLVAYHNSGESKSLHVNRTFLSLVKLA